MSSEADRRRVTVVVPVYGSVDLASACLRSLALTLPRDVHLMVVDDLGEPRITAEQVRVAVGGRQAQLVLNPVNRGFVGTVNDAAASRPDDDLVIVNSDVQVLAGWFEPLVTAAYSSSTTASATALADNGGIVSVPEIGEAALRDAAWVERTRASVSAVLDIPWVRVPVAVGHVCLLRRDALDVIGGLDPVFSPGYGEEVDWSHRASRAGLHHVAALTSWATHADGASFGDRRSALRRDHEWVLLRRYPWRTVSLRVHARSPRSPWRHALDLVAASLRGAR